MQITPEITAVFDLIRLGTGLMSSDRCCLPSYLDWADIISFSIKHGVIGVVADGLEKVQKECLPDTFTIMDIVGAAGRYEKNYDQKLNAIEPLAEAWNKDGLRVAILKGMAFGRYYPNAKHRSSSDVDVFLMDKGQGSWVKGQESWVKGYGSRGKSQESRVRSHGAQGRKVVFDRGNDIARKLGLSVDTQIWKHSQITIDGVLVESHYTCCGQLGDKRIAALEDFLEGQLMYEQGEILTGTHLEMPTLMFNALFYLYHAWGHFIIEGGMILQNILDWIMIVREIDKNGKRDEVESLCEKFGLSKFYKAVDGVAAYMMGMIQFDELGESQRLLLEEILNMPATNAETITERSMFSRRFGMLVEMYDNRWKYPLYSDISLCKMILLYVKGYFNRLMVRQ